jgi:hypothetical protein
MDDMQELKQDVKEIKTQIVELVKQGAVHNHLLKEHERRSLALESQMKPVQRHVDWVEKVLKISGAVMLALIIQYITKTFI